MGITVGKVSKYGVFSGPCGPAFGLNMEKCAVSLRIQSEYGKIRTRKNCVFGHFSRSALFFKQWDLMRPVSMIGQKNCWTKKCEIKIVNRKSKLARISKLGVANEKNVTEIELPRIFPLVYNFQKVELKNILTQKDENKQWEYRRERYEKKEKD